MERDDPFDSLKQLCHVSSSQEQELSHCDFSGEPDDEIFSGDGIGIPVASTGIVMLPLPDSPEEDSQPQQQKIVSVDPPVEVVGVTDNGNSAERIKINSASKSSLGVSQLNYNKVIHCESINFRIEEERQVILSDGFEETSAKKLKIVDTILVLNSPKHCLGLETKQRVVKSMEKLKSPSKNSKFLDENVVSESSRITPGTKTRSLSHAAKKLSFEGASPSNCLNPLQNHQFENVNGVDKGDGYAKRNIQSVSAVNEGETTKINRLCNNSNETSSSSANSNRRLKDRIMKCIDAINKLRDVGPTNEKPSRMHKDRGIKRALPVSLLGNNSNNPQGEVVSREITVFDVLRELAKEYSFDPSLSKLSALETAKMAGMTFP